MTLPEIAIFAVATERLFVVAAGITAVVLGWNLFARAIMPNQSGTVAVGDWKVELKSVGPGVFFSLFGTIVLLYAFVRPAEYTVTQNTQPANVGGPTTTVKALGVGAAVDATTLRYVRSINTVVQIGAQVSARPHGAPATLGAAQVSDLTAATDRLKEMREEIVVKKFGREAFEEWQKNAAAFREQKHSLAADVQIRLEKIAPWFTQTVTDDGGQ